MTYVSAAAVALLLAASLDAQHFLDVDPTGLYTAWSPSVPPAPQTFFDLTVLTPITLTGIDMPLLSPVGTVGTLELYTHADTFVGNETTSDNWTLVSSSQVIVTRPYDRIGGGNTHACLSLSGVG